MELARRARAPLYDIGYPFLRSWLYGIGGFIVVIAAFAIGLTLARNGGGQTAEASRSEPVSPNQAPDDIIVVQPEVETPRFPNFAPEGVIVVRAPERREPTFAAAQPARDYQRIARASLRRPAERAEQTIASPASQLTEPEPRNPETRPADRDQAIQRTEDPAPPTRDDEEQASETVTEADARSWYGSTEYWREVRARQRAEREARRRH